MPAIVARDFFGMQLGRSVRLLPPNAATNAVNIDLSSGSLYPMLRPVRVYAAPGTNAKKIVRIKFNDGAIFWLPLTHRLSDVIKSPVVNDTHERVYILDPPGTPLRFTTKARLLAGQPSFLLGLPAPSAAPTLTVTGGSGPTETRAYVYTFVDAYGHEGPPSEPALQSGPVDGTWVVSGMDTLVPDAGQRPAVSKRVYRSLATSQGISGYFFVADVPLLDATYSDVIPGTTVALNNPLESTSFYAPPEALDGMILMPGGFILGWSGRDLHFSVPYRPWAWPPEFDLTLEHAIVGAGITGQTAICATTGAPYALTGTSPAQITMAKLEAIEPCLDKSTVLGGDDGVYFASRHGVVVATAGGARVATIGVIPEKDWMNGLKGTVVGAAKTMSQYMIMTDAGRGWRLDTLRDRLSVSRLQNLSRFSSLWNDAVTGNPVVIDTFDPDGPFVHEFSPDVSVAVPFLWASGELNTPKPVNFSCGRIELDTGSLVGRFTPRQASDVASELAWSFDAVGVWPPGEDQHAWRFAGSSIPNYCLPNTCLFAGTIQAGELAPGTDSFGDLFVWPFWPGMAVPNTFMYLTSVSLPQGVPCWFWYWAGRRLAFSGPILDDSMFRLPSGFKSDVHAFAVVSICPIHSIQMALSPSELETV